MPLRLLKLMAGLGPSGLDYLSSSRTPTRAVVVVCLIDKINGSPLVEDAKKKDERAASEKWKCGCLRWGTFSSRTAC